MKYKKIIISLLLIIAVIPFSLAEQVPLYLFYGLGCLHCAKSVEFLDQLSEKYPELEVKKYEIYFDEQNRELFLQFCSELDKSVQGVPTIFIDEKTFIGFSSNIALQIEEEVKRCINKGCEDVGEKCVLNGQIIGETDPIDPSYKTYHSIIGWIFIIFVLLIVLYFIIKKIIKNK